MAESNIPVSSQPEIESEEVSLKNLDVVQKATEHAVSYASKAYDYAKDNSGSLKPGMANIEGTLKTVAGPAYDTVHDIPANVLKFADLKAKESVAKAKSTSLASNIKNAGVVETVSGLTESAYTKIEPTAKELSEKYEPVVEQHAASAWQSLNKIPFVSDVAKVITPAAACVSDKYNETVQKTAEEGCKVSSCLPLVPTEKIAKVFKTSEPEAKPTPEPEVASGAEGAVVGR